jgi:hypothetical protein
VQSSKKSGVLIHVTVVFFFIGSCSPAAGPPVVVGSAGDNAPLPSGAQSSNSQRFVGIYVMTMPGENSATRNLRIFEENGVLLGQIDQNDPSRLIRIADGVFRPEAAPGTVTFSMGGEQEQTVIIDTAQGKMSGVRVATGADESRAGVLYSELVRADAELFRAAYVTCDAAKVNTFLNDDIEFYHDRTGARFGSEVRDDFKKLTSNCPVQQGVKRRLVAHSMRVFPIKGDYAVQVGEHRFVQANGRTTSARFVNLWQKRNGTWRLARVLSFDHHSEAAK